MANSVKNLGIDGVLYGVVEVVGYGLCCLHRHHWFSILVWCKNSGRDLNEATLMRQKNAAEMEKIRQEGQDGIAALRAQMADERNQVEAEVAEAGAELANLSDELVAGRAELQQFIALRSKTYNFIQRDVLSYFGFKWMQ